MTASPACLSRQVGDFLPPAGGVPALPPPYPAISFTFCPLSPQPPSPAGKGETKVISCKGLRPLHPWG